MADETSDGSNDQNLPNKIKIFDLELRYIQLLETKINQLEQNLRAADGDCDATNRRSTVEEYDSEAGVGGEIENSDQALKENLTSSQKESRYSIIVSKWDPDSGVYLDTDATDEQNEPSEKGCIAFEIRKFTVMRTQSQSTSTFSEVLIEYEPLQKLIGRLTLKWGWSELVTNCISPYRPLIWSWQEANEEARKVVEGESSEDKQARTDLGELLRILSSSPSHYALEKYLKHRQSFLDEGTITHAALWTLFPPGTLIVSKPFLDQYQVFTVSSCDNFIEENHAFNLICFGFDWDGHGFTRVHFKMMIPFWGPDRRSIVELPVYPLRYYTESTSRGKSLAEDAIPRLRNKLIERGKKFVNHCAANKGKQIFKYSGDAHLHTGRSFLHTVESSDNDPDRYSDEGSSTARNGGSSVYNNVSYTNIKKIHGTVMVDFESFFEYLSLNTPILGNLQRFDGQLELLTPERRENPIFKEMYKLDWDRYTSWLEFTDDQYLHCLPRVLGYALKQKRWAQLLVERLKPPNPADASVFRDKLQLDEDAKDLVRWSVQAHERGKEMNQRGEVKSLQDFAPDKGKGLVIMLYGYPGVGKTLTAESVALMVGRPLLTVGVSDIGVGGDKVEANLQKVFDLAAKWEAILLFDEADIFLEARGQGQNDFKRNAMVSDIAIKYDDLSPIQQIRIFESFLEQLHHKKLVHNIEDVLDWVRRDGRTPKFNGRQIRNVVSTAMGIALVDEENGRKLRREHLVKVAEHTKNFKVELQSQEDLYKSLLK